MNKLNMNREIYFDYSSSTPIYPEIKENLNFNTIGNSAAEHFFGKRQKDKLEKARLSIAQRFNRDYEHVIFTSGATESNNLLIHGIKADIFFIDPTSHVSSLMPVKEYNYILLKVDHNGLIDQNYLHDLINEYKDKRICIVITVVNHMTGVYQNLDLSGICKRNNIIIHADCAQAINMVDNYDHYDSITISGHKIGAPIGIGALIINEKTKQFPLYPLMNGSKMEFGYRPGTVNHIFAQALDQALNIKYDHISHDLFEKKIIEHGGIVIGYNAQRNGSISCVVMPKVLNIVQIYEFEKRHICVSIGSSCASSEYIFKAMNRNDILNAIRISSGRFNIEEDMNILTKAWIEIKKSLE